MPAVEPTLRMTPPPWSRMCGAMARNEQEDRLHVDAEHAVEFRFVDLEYRAVPVRDAGVVDE